MKNKNINSNSKIKDIIIYYINQYRMLFIVLFLCVIATTFSGSAYPYIFGLLVDKVFTEKDFSMLAAIVIIYVVVFVVNQCLHFLLNMSWSKLMVKYIYHIREDMFRIFQNMPCKVLADRKSGDVIQRINWDSEQFLHFVHKNIFYLVASVLELLIALGMIFYMNWITGILVAVVTPVVVYTTRYFSKKVGKYYKEKTKLNGERSALIFEVIQHIHEIKLMRAQKNVSEIYSEQNEMSFSNKLDIAKEEVKITQLNSGMLLIAQMAVFSMSVFLIMRDDITIGTIIAILGYFDTCISSFNSINKKIVALRDNQSSIVRCIEVLEMSTEDYNAGGLAHGIASPVISFENVSFSYNGSDNILENIDLTVNEHEVLGVVGMSGCGKSTLVSLVNKLYTPSAGRVTIDGIDVNDYQLHYLRDQIGVVYQENCFFNGSVRFNLIFSEDRSRDNELLDLLEKVGLRSFIEELPEGLDTVIMDGKINLSGGQKQRLAIVRACAKKPKIMIFDEATSALDSESESAVLKTWTDLFPDSTKIIIAHRLSTIINADRIALVNDHHIEMVGSHDELMKNCPNYQSLFFEQAQLEQ